MPGSADACSGAAARRAGSWPRAWRSAPRRSCAGRRRRGSTHSAAAPAAPRKRAGVEALGVGPELRVPVRAPRGHGQHAPGRDVVPGEPQRGRGGPVHRVRRRVQPHGLHQCGPGDPQALEVAGVGRPGAGPDPAPSTLGAPPRPGRRGGSPAGAAWTSARPRSSRGRRAGTPAPGRGPPAGSGRRHRRGRRRRAAGRRGRPVRGRGRCAPERGEHLLHHLLQLAVQPSGPAVAQRGPPHRHLHHLQAAPADRVARPRGISASSTGTSRSTSSPNRVRPTTRSV